MENILYSTTVQQQSWDQVIDYVVNTFEEDTYILNAERCLVSFVNVAMLEAFVAANPQWLAH